MTEIISNDSAYFDEKCHGLIYFRCVISIELLFSCHFIATTPDIAVFRGYAKNNMQRMLKLANAADRKIAHSRHENQKKKSNNITFLYKFWSRLLSLIEGHFLVLLVQQPSKAS